MHNSINRRTAVIVTVHPAYAETLPFILQAIDAQTLPFGHKILVYDAAFEPEAPTLQVPADWTVIAGNYRNPNVARNEGLKNLPPGVEWVCFWDADNVMPNTYFQASAMVLLSVDSRIGICYPDVQEIRPDGTFGYFHRMEEWSASRERFSNIADTSSFWRVAAVNQVGGFNPLQMGHDDYALAQAIFRLGWHGRRSGVIVNHVQHAGARSMQRDLTQSLWTAYSFAFVTLWSGNRDNAEAVLIWLANADLPPNCSLYWVDNSGGEMLQMLLGVYHCLLAKKFRRITVIDGGAPHTAAPGEKSNAFGRHAHVAKLYNLVLPGLREDIVVTLEDDTIPARSALFTLLSNFVPGSKLAMAAGVYRARHSPAHICASRDKKKWRDVPKFDELPAGPFEVGMTGGGFALIANNVLQKCLPMRCELTDDGRMMGWDGNLGLSFSALGWKMVADPRVPCTHLCEEVKAWIRGERPACPPAAGYDGPYPYEYC